MTSSNILSSYKLNSGLILANRVVMGSMHMGWEEAENGEHHLKAFYETRARSGVGLIITGGVSPNKDGVIAKGAAYLDDSSQLDRHRIISSAVVGTETKICFQILHAGRYAIKKDNLAPSAIPTRINPFPPQALSEDDIIRTIEDFANTAQLAEKAGYHGVEIMGSEGYLINQFSANRTNQRDDKWGGSIENRSRFALEIVKAIRAVVSKKFLVIFRLSMLDLVEGGNAWDEIVFQAKALKKAGIDILNTGIGWHESTIPTIAGVVPSNGFLWVTEKMRSEIDLPIIATNRFTDLEEANQAIKSQKTDFVSMARPFLADPDLVSKYTDGLGHKVNTCIACNQACLDHIFESKPASCLVNPRAGRELFSALTPANQKKKIVVVGAGPAGMSFSCYAAERGHQVSLIEKRNCLGGQFNEASKVPGKKLYLETIRYFQNRMKDLKVSVETGTSFDATKHLKDQELLVWAAGVRPRVPDIPGLAQSSRVRSYHELLNEGIREGTRNIALIGGGGIAVDIAHFLYKSDDENYYDFWGIDQSLSNPGGLKKPEIKRSELNVTMFMRSTGKIGKSLGKTTAWIHRLYLAKKGIHVVKNISYKTVSEGDLTFELNGELKTLNFDEIILCSGQQSIKPPSFLDGLNIEVHSIGGSNDSSGLDAQRAILEAYSLASKL